MKTDLSFTRMARRAALSMILLPALIGYGEDYYEPDDTPDQAAYIRGIHVEADRQTHSIEPAYDIDWMVFSVGQQSSVTIETSGDPGNDTQLWLFDGGLAEIGYNDDIDRDARNLYSRIVRDCSDPIEAGTYYIKVEEFGNDDIIRDYNISVIVRPCAVWHLYVDDDAPADPGKNTVDISDPLEDGTPAHPFDAIAEALSELGKREGYGPDVGIDTVEVKPGLYQGQGNRDMFFPPDIDVHVLGYGPESTIIDCQGSAAEPHRAFWMSFKPHVIQDLTIRNGYAEGGGGIRCTEARAMAIVDCVITDNTGGGIVAEETGVIVEDCQITNNRSLGDRAAGLHFQNATPVIRRCTITGNRSLSATSAGGGLHCAFPPEPGWIEECTISDNDTPGNGGGVHFEYGAPIMERCIITDNASFQKGGGIFFNEGTRAEVSNCLIMRNFSVRGGGTASEHDNNPRVINCSIVNNSSSQAGGGMYFATYSRAETLNTIIWGNGIDVTDVTEPLDRIVLEYCSIGSATGSERWFGTGCINTDPKFVHIYGDNYHLMPGSPCIDAGRGDGTPAMDMNLRPRYDDPTVPNTGAGSPAYCDMGAYEFRAYYVLGDGGQDNWDGATPEWDQSLGSGPMQTIQHAIDVSNTGETVIVRPGLYTGPGNTQLNFNGKEIVLMAESLFARPTIDGEGVVRCFDFFHSETPAAVE